jgi:hypothetical protein
MSSSLVVLLRAGRFGCRIFLWAKLSLLLADRAGAAQVAIQDMGTGDNHSAGSLQVMLTGAVLEQAHGRHNDQQADNSNARR